MDEEIKTCVKSIFGDNVEIVDCEKNASVLEEELIQINGIPVNLNSLDGTDAHAIKLALLEGAIPSVDILNKLLTEAGLLQQPMQLETTLSVKSCLSTKQHVNVSKHGQMIDAHSTQSKEECIYQSQEKVIWQPPPPSVKTLIAAQQCRQMTSGNSNSTINTGTTTSDRSTTVSQDSGNRLQDELEIVATCSGASLYNTTSTSGQDLWPTNSAASNVLESTTAADDNISRLTGDLSIDSGYPPVENSNNKCKYKLTRTIIYEEGVLVSGTIEALTALLVPKHNYVPDTTFSYTFLLNARLFSPPQLLFENMLNIWQSRYDLLDTDVAERINSINNLLRLLLHWLNNFPSDFFLPKIKEQLHKLLQQIPNTDLKPSFLQSLQTVSNSTVIFNTKSNKVKDDSTQQHTIIQLKELCQHAKELAQNLLFLELRYLSKISAEQFLQANSFNIEQYKLWTQQLTLLVAQHILKFTKTKHRVAILQYWVEAAEECFYCGNFNSLWAVLHAFRLPAVSRLRKMWSKIDKSSLSKLETQLDAQENYANYRESIKMAQSHAPNKQMVSIPYFHMLHADIQLLANNSTQMFPDGQINFEKCLKLAEKVQKEFEILRRFEVKITTSSEVISLLLNASNEKCIEDQFMLWSYACESPQNAEEKKILKLLKSKIKASK